jgi:hypothetical protein
MAEAVLELVCGRPRCGEWWMRWTVDLEQPFDGQLQTSAQGELYLSPTSRPGVLSTQTLGGLYPASDGRWYRWAPGDAAALPEGQGYSRYRFTCPGGHPTDVKPRVHKLDDAVLKALRHMYDTRAPRLRTTVDKLLALSS